MIFIPPPAYKRLAGYYQSEGEQVGSIIVQDGSLFYSDLPGQSVPASNFGLKAITHAIAGLSDDGQYNVVVNHIDPGDAPVDSIKLFWFVAATSLPAGEVVDLSARSVRIRARGYI